MLLPIHSSISLFLVGILSIITIEAVAQSNQVNLASSTKRATTVTPLIVAQTSSASVQANHPSTSLPGSVTYITVQNTGKTQENVPLTFGQVFAPGDIFANYTITGKLSDGSPLSLQINPKARNSDGSLRHAIISAVLPKITANQSQTIYLFKSVAENPAKGVTPAGLLASGFDAVASINLGGQNYSASVAPQLRSGKYTNWLEGAIVNEWLVSAPLISAQGIPHPHLTARFSIRTYTGLNKAKVDFIIENNWAYQPAPQNFTYDVQLSVGGKTVYTKAALKHYHHARWYKSFWWGGSPEIHIQHNPTYLIASKALPNYDQTLLFSPVILGKLKTMFAASNIEPMGNGLAMQAMGSGGGRWDIGLNPGWAVTYLLSQDKDAKQATLGAAELAGSWPIHYRDKVSDKPISILDYPYMTIMGNVSDTYNPTTRKSEAFPVCTGDCHVPNLPDAEHEPSFNYIPYLVTGDYFQLEELQFWAMYNIFRTNPSYRKYAKGLIHHTEVRGQSWVLRTLADAAYLTPDQDPLKKHFEALLSNNLDWYNAAYTNNIIADNSLGFITEYAMIYTNNTGMAPWQDDFFTSSIGHVAELGYQKALPLLKWKAKFPVSRINGPGYCWILAASYSIQVRDNESSPVYTDISKSYKHNSVSNLNCASAEMATALKLKIGEMSGYANDTAGYPSNLQPALAYAVDSGISSASNAWKTFTNRSIKPDYATGPQFAIVPR